jgi:uncharacterized protein YfaP (DUF2135 family)
VKGKNNSLDIKVVTPAGDYWGIKAISPNGNVFDVKALDLEEGGELIHIKAVPQIYK